MITEQDKVYIAGPMTGIPELNYPAFNRAEKRISEKIGCRILNPARQPDGLEYEEYMRRGFADIEEATAIFLITGWEKSKGAVRELKYAIRKGKKIFFEEEVTGEKCPH